MISYPHNDHIMTIFSSTRRLWLSQSKFILGVQTAFEECLKWLWELYLSSSVTWCRYQIAATNSYPSFSKDGWTKPYFLFIQPVKSLSIALTILHWSWYRWVQFPPIPLTPEADADTPNHGLVQLEWRWFVTVPAVAVSFPVPFGSSDTEFGAGLVSLCCCYNTGSSPPSCPSSNNPCPIPPFSCHILLARKGFQAVTFIISSRGIQLILLKIFFSKVKYIQQ